jgi:hypothetical protein
MGTSFQRGMKTTDGVTCAPGILTEHLSSNGITIYTAIKWADGMTSCNCVGWATRKKCKHSTAVAVATQSSHLTADGAARSLERSHDEMAAAAAARPRKLSRGIDV